MDRILERTLLYDFYGELLKEHAKSIYEDALLNDLSLSEIATDRGITRQAVHDVIKRCNIQLEGYENKLHLVEKFEKTKEKVEKIHAITRDYRTTKNPSLLDEITTLSEEILKDF